MVYILKRLICVGLFKAMIFSLFVKAKFFIASITSNINNRGYQFFLFLLLIFLGFSGCKTNRLITKEATLNQILETFHDSASDEVLIAAHRASNDKFPENSLAAIQYSIETGVDIIEIDIRTTKDGQLVLMHDETIDRTTNGKGAVESFNYDELLAFELNKKAKDTSSHRIPLAKEALELAKDKIMIDLDIKEVYIKDLVALVHQTKTEKQVLFFDSNFDILDSVIIIDSTLLLMPRAHSLAEVKKIINKYHPSVIHIDPSFYTKDVISTIKKSDARIWINALNAPDEKALLGFVNKAYTPLVEGGANIIQTDLPLILYQFLKENKERNK